MNEIKTVIFDVDGVIINSKEIKLSSVILILKQFNLTYEDVKEILDGRMFLLNRIIWLKEIINKYKLDTTVENLSKLFTKHIEDNLDKVPTINETINFIEKEHKNYTFFINTAMPHKDIENILENKKLKQYFKEIYSFDTGNKKENILSIMKKYNFEPKAVLFVDDEEKNISDTKELEIKTLLFDITKSKNYYN